jgi:RNA polymerase sigma factor (sigma-70 family)
MTPVATRPLGSADTRPDREGARLARNARLARLNRAAARGDRAARDRLVEEELYLVRGIAARYRNCGLPVEDLVQEGALGLLEAVDRFDPDRGSFESYARFRVRRAITNALTEQARVIRLPKHIVERRRALDHAEAALLAAGGHSTPGALAAATGLPPSAVVAARTAPQASLSLDDPVATGVPLEAVIANPLSADPVAALIREEDSADLARAVAHLPRRQREVVTARWGLNGSSEPTGRVLAAEMHASPRRTQALTRQALLRLRRDLERIPAS